MSNSNADRGTDLGTVALASTEPAQSASERSATAGSDLNLRAILAIVLVAYAMIVLDISIVITGLPEIHRALHFSSASLSWVQNAYLLTFGGLLLLGARIGDLFGRRRLFIIGLSLFSIASVAVGSAQSEVWLIAARAIQGIGAAILAPSTLALLQTSFREGHQRTRAVSAYAAVAGVASTVGLVVGGMFASWLTWRVGFFINAPIGVAMVVASRRFLPETDRRSGSADVPGGLISTAGVAALVYGIVHSADAGWSDSATVAFLAIGVVLLCGFVLHERKAKQPIMPLRLFADRRRSGAYAARLLFLGAMAPFWFFTVQYLQGVAGDSAVVAGAAFLPATVANFAAAMLIPRLSRRWDHTAQLIVALVISIIGMAWLARLHAGTPYLTGIALPMILIGIGQGGALAPLTAAGIAGVSHEDAGAAGGVTNVAHQIGASLGLGILVAVFAGAGAAGLHGPELLAHRIAASLTAGAALLVLALVVAVVARGRTGRLAATEIVPTRSCASGAVAE
jgi:EmrB/QacA subfamily drug resistance transporter